MNIQSYKLPIARISLCLLTTLSCVAVQSGLVHGASEIAVVVNSDVITKADIEKRASLILFSSGKKVETASKEVIRQVEEALIQEKLQRQIADRLKITVSKNEVNQAIEGIAKENNMTMEQMKALFASKGVALTTLAERIKSNLLWIKSVRDVFAHNIRISDRELEEEKKRLTANENKEQVQLAEVVLFVDSPNRQSHVKSEIHSLHTTLKNGTPFVEVARNFSQSPSGAQGGLIGWIPKDQAPKAAATLNVGEFSAPVEQGNRYVIYYCKDHKMPGQAAASEAKLHYMTAGFKIHEDLTQPPPDTLVSFQAEAANIKSCATFKESAELHAAQFNNVQDVPIVGIPEELKKLLIQTKKNNVTAPVRVSPTDIMFFILCDQKTPEKKAPLSNNEVKMLLMEKRVQDQAIAQFNRIKTTATIEYRAAR